MKLKEKLPVTKYQVIADVGYKTEVLQETSTIEPALQLIKDLEENKLDNCAFDCLCDIKLDEIKHISLQMKIELFSSDVILDK